MTNIIIVIFCCILYYLKSSGSRDGSRGLGPLSQHVGILKQNKDNQTNVQGEKIQSCILIVNN